MNSVGDYAPLEIWAGLESTVNRIGDRYMDQCSLNGHDARTTDLEKISSLGLRVIRYPALWEKIEISPGVFDWTSTDFAMGELRRFEFEPIIGLLHHGSGPKWTSLVDADFPEMFARFASAFAQRYPWIKNYTPINEPLTTARFSCLYGAWYPHHRDDHSFVRAVYLQMKAISLAMSAIRLVQPAALLVQTEDLGKTVSSKPLEYQADFENVRRWLTFDFLLRRVDETHPLHAYLAQAGLLTEERQWLLNNACAPDILGINHYPLSNRYLDHKIDDYPVELRGGNGRDRYVDVSAVHFAVSKNVPIEKLLREVASRYRGRAFAVTEVHLDGPRESQMRWLADVWTNCQILRSEGLPLLAVTAWSLLGTYNWNSLCTRDDNYYESGVFDVRSSKIRATALARMISDLASKKGVRHEPVLSEAGWWRQKSAHPKSQKKRGGIVITGGQGVLASSLARLCEMRGLGAILLSEEDLDIRDAFAVRRVLHELRPWAVINAAGYTRIDEAELGSESIRCQTINVLGSENLARSCHEQGIRFVTFSSNHVFSGETATPYVESDQIAPLSVYGRSQGQADQTVLGLEPQTLVVRTSALFGAWDETNFIARCLKQLKKGEPVTAFDNVTVSPTYIPDLVNTVLDLLIDHESGLIHLTNRGAATWAELAKLVVNGIGIDQALIREISYDPATDSALAARPLYSAMTSERALYLPDYQGAIDRYIKELAVAL